MTIVRNSCQEEIREIKSWILSGDTTEQQIITINKSIQNLFESMEQGSSGPIRELHAFLDKHLKTDSVFGLSKLKPRGYAGDFESIDRVHTYFISENPKYTHLDRFLQATQAAIAVRNRKIYLKNKLLQFLHLQNRSNVLNIGCGPARDVYEFFVEHPEANITIDCIDLDSNAIAFARNLCAPLHKPINFFHQNILEFTPTETYDLVWSAGLFDYFNDELFVFAIKRLLSWVTTGGQIIIGNFASQNPTQPMMEVLLDWKLIYRSSEHLLTLAQRAGVAHNNATVEIGNEGIQLFLVIQC